jgi:hypothetical protein
MAGVADQRTAARRTTYCPDRRALMLLPDMGAATWAVTGILVFLGVAANRARRKAAGQPIYHYTGQAAFGLFCIALGLDYLRRTDKPWPYAVLVTGLIYVLLDWLGPRLEKPDQPAIQSSPLRLAGFVLAGLGGLFVVAIVALAFYLGGIDGVGIAIGTGGLAIATVGGFMVALTGKARPSR